MQDKLITRCQNQFVTLRHKISIENFENRILKVTLQTTYIMIDYNS